MLSDGRVTDQDDFRDLLSQITTEHLPDSLRVACNNEFGERLARLLLDEDSKRLHVLDGSTTDAAAQETAARLICELLETCIVRRHTECVATLVTLPAAQLLGELLPHQGLQLGRAWRELSSCL